MTEADRRLVRELMARADSLEECNPDARLMRRAAAAIERLAKLADSLAGGS